MVATSRAAREAQETVTTNSFFRLIYRSHSRIPAVGRKAELGSIFSEARSNNKAADITGALLITDNYFAQALEGEETAVRALFERISRDPRHEDVLLVDEQPVDHRVFSRWAMAEVSKDGSADIPLLASTEHGGISVGAPRPSTPRAVRRPAAHAQHDRRRHGLAPPGQRARSSRRCSA